MFISINRYMAVDGLEADMMLDCRRLDGGGGRRSPGGLWDPVGARRQLAFGSRSLNETT